MINFWPFYCSYYRGVEFMDNKPFCSQNCLYVWFQALSCPGIKPNFHKIETLGGKIEKDKKR